MPLLAPRGAAGPAASSALSLLDRRARATCPRASRRCAARSTGATTCSTPASRRCCAAWPSSPAASTSEAAEAAQRGDDRRAGPAASIRSRPSPRSSIAACCTARRAWRPSPGSRCSRPCVPTCASASPTRERRRPRTCGWPGSARNSSAQRRARLPRDPVRGRARPAGPRAEQPARRPRQPSWPASQRSRSSSAPICFASGAARHVREGRDWLERALRAGGPDVPPAVRAASALRGHVAGATSRATTVLGAVWRASAWRRRSRPTTP